VCGEGEESAVREEKFFRVFVVCETFSDRTFGNVKSEEECGGWVEGFCWINYVLYIEKISRELLVC